MQKDLSIFNLGEITHSTICITVITELGVFIQTEGRVWRYFQPNSGGYDAACNETQFY